MHARLIVDLIGLGKITNVDL